MIPNIFSVATLNVRGLGHRRKLNCIFETVKDLDVICLQETHFLTLNDCSDFNVIFSSKFEIFHTFACNDEKFSGVTLLINRSFPATVATEKTFVNGRAKHVSLVFNNLSIFLLGLYASANGRQRAGFFSNLYDELLQSDFYNHDTIIILGDFNLVFENCLDRSNNQVERPNIGLREAKNVIDLMNVFDVFRETNPAKREYTFFSGAHGSESRIDNILTSSNLVSYYKKYENRSVNLTDHTCFVILFSTNIAKVVRGPSYFKLNTLLLNDPHVCSYVEHELNNFNTEGDILEEWDLLKVRLKHYFMNITRRRAFVRKQTRITTENEIQLIKHRLHDEPRDPFLKRRLKEESLRLERLNSYYVQECLHNTHYRDYVEDRASLVSIKSANRKSAEARTFFSLKTETGDVVTNSREILNELSNQFTQLFQKRNCNEILQRNFLETPGLSRLSDIQKMSLENEITVAEIEKSIFSFARRKSPGGDGLPIEFYFRFRTKLIPILHKLYICCCRRNGLNYSMNHGIISMLYKNKGDRNERKNWRPITLLNVDYKILSKILTTRLKTVIGTLVHMDQSCAVPGRDIFDGIFTIYNIVENANINNDNLILLLVDHIRALLI
jgi:exonuclease III